MSEIIYISNARLSFPHIVEARQRRNETTGEIKINFECDLIVEPSNPAWTAIMQEYAKLAAEVGGENANALMQMINSDRKSRCFAQGHEKVNKKTFQPYDGYVGNYSISASNKNRPQVIDASGNPVDSDNTMAYQALARKLYGGCRVNAAVKLWWQKANAQKGYGHGIRCDLIALQFFKDDTPFGDAPADASGMFGAVAGAAPAGLPASPFGAPAGQMPGLPFGMAPAAAPAAPAFGAPGVPSFMQR